jgi:hypothetical protein
VDENVYSVVEATFVCGGGGCDFGEEINDLVVMKNAKERPHYLYGI